MANVATKTDLREFEQWLELRFTALDTRFEQIERRIDTMTNRLVAVMVVALTLLFAALHFGRCIRERVSKARGEAREFVEPAAAVAALGATRRRSCCGARRSSRRGQEHLDIGLIRKGWAHLKMARRP